MTEIIRSEGIVLRRRDFGETSRIAVVYTRAAGKVQLHAKGARVARNRFGAALEPLTRGEYVFYWRESKDLFILSETAIIAGGQAVREDPARLPYGLAMAEAADRLSAEGDADVDFYDALAAALAALATGPAPLLLIQLLMRFAGRLGLAPDLSACVVCGRADFAAGARFDLAEGGICCRDCRPGAQTLELSAAALALFQSLARFGPEHLRRVKAPPETALQSLGLIRSHLHYRTGLELRSLALVGSGI